MFSGIIEAMGVVRKIVDREEIREISIEAPTLCADLAIGDSVSLDGACHTVTKLVVDGFTVDSVGTTLSRTVAAQYEEGSRINLERALVVGTRLDGHFVQGHVDGTGRVLSLRREGEYWLLDIELPPFVAEVTILHGSIAINGVSLTINTLPSEESCQVAIIPHTWMHTNLNSLSVGDSVNLEGDLIGKHVLKGLTQRAPDRQLDGG